MSLIVVVCRVVVVIQGPPSLHSSTSGAPGQQPEEPPSLPKVIIVCVCVCVCVCTYVNCIMHTHIYTQSYYWT